MTPLTRDKLFRYRVGVGYKTHTVFEDDVLSALQGLQVTLNKRHSSIGDIVGLSEQEASMYRIGVKFAINQLQEWFPILQESQSPMPRTEPNLNNSGTGQEEGKTSPGRNTETVSVGGGEQTRTYSTERYNCKYCFDRRTVLFNLPEKLYTKPCPKCSQPKNSKQGSDLIYPQSGDAGELDSYRDSGVHAIKDAGASPGEEKK